MKNSASRRRFLQSGAAGALAAGFPFACGPAEAPPAALRYSSPFYDKLGVKPVINGVGTVTNLGGSIMPLEVIDAMVEASRHFIPFRELQEKAAAHIARLIGVPGAMISAGAASAITCGTAACVTRGDDEKLRALPDTSGMKNEIIQQRAHRSGYEAQMLVVGTKIIWVDTRQEAEKAISDRTAMMFFLNKADPLGQIPRNEWIEIARSNGVPTLNDAAADVPPVERLWKYVEEGFDLVVFSGGKGLLGPQATGLLLGDGDLTAAARKAISPHGGIGRGMKVGKEEIAGLVTAVERYLKVDHEAERAELDARAEQVIGALASVEGVACEKHVPEIHNRVPHVLVNWEPGAKGFDAREGLDRLRAGDPPIEVSVTGDGQFRISMWMLRPGEAEVVAERVRALFV